MAGKARATTYVEMVKEVTAILFSLGMVVRVSFIDEHRNWPAGVSLDASASVNTSEYDRSRSGEWHPPVEGRGRPAPIPVETPEEAIPLILEGRVVELREVRSVHTVLVRLAGMARQARAQGRDEPSYDLCQVWVARSKLFCGASLRSESHPFGVLRSEMPQLEGRPVPGSLAESLPPSPWNASEVDGTAEFIEYLRSIGLGLSHENVPATRLKPSQCELVGPIVAAMMVDERFDPSRNPVFISRDDYLVDGHHRWAAVVGRDAADGRLGDATLAAVRVDAPVSEVLRIANEWAAAYGIQHAAGSVSGSCRLDIRRKRIHGDDTPFRMRLGPAMRTAAFAGRSFEPRRAQALRDPAQHLLRARVPDLL
jgi:hypothetical protein